MKYSKFLNGKKTAKQTSFLNENQGENRKILEIFLNKTTSLKGIIYQITFHILYSVLILNECLQNLKVSQKFRGGQDF